MGYKVGLTDDARSDLHAAVRFIAVDGQNPEAALRLGNELLDAAFTCDLPASGFARAAATRDAETVVPLLADLLPGERS
jgi:hypothetical protein